MNIEEDKLKAALDFEKNAKDIPLWEIPGYKEWSEKKLKEGVLPSTIAHLDSYSMWMKPENISEVTEEDFEEMLEEIESDLE